MVPDLISSQSSPMKSFFLSLAVATAILPSFASAMSASDFDSQVIGGKPLNIAARFLAGELDAQIIKNYPSTNGVDKTDWTGVAHNRTELHKYSTCVVDPTKCSSVSR